MLETKFFHRILPIIIKIGFVTLTERSMVQFELLKALVVIIIVRIMRQVDLWLSGSPGRALPGFTAGFIQIVI